MQDYQLKAMADRVVRAHNDFIGSLQSFGELGREEAIKVLEHYKKKNMIKLDAGIGVIRVKHGRYLDRDFLQAVADKLS